MLFILLSLCLVLSIVFLRRKYGALEKMGIPVIKPGLCLGSEPLMIHQTDYIQWDMDATRDYGNTWGSYAISEPWITVGDPKLIKAITVKLMLPFSSFSPIVNLMPSAFSGFSLVPAKLSVSASIVLPVIVKS